MSYTSCKARARHYAMPDMYTALVGNIIYQCKRYSTTYKWRLNGRIWSCGPSPPEPISYIFSEIHLKGTKVFWGVYNFHRSDNIGYFWADLAENPAALTELLEYILLEQ